MQGKGRNHGRSKISIKRGLAKTRYPQRSGKHQAEARALREGHPSTPSGRTNGKKTVQRNGRQAQSPKAPAPVAP
ncbi:MAG: hypothetical protein A3C30_02750 [Candidatus Levybacteria bacterium RIFCSPHIGHO2_02_FULL_40_18]|nr:MAG: hypothetical protein A3C30_02750 [Candidatus Levybacteria bacterium RIFCSPHIGHO2_02_FULL_40_18]OGH32017.1 MAG: hypothetical protein A3E43_03730 [Candidatus Levybacteria bacterium RIFCSPHIGHO2_12_FULL_40_31]OGH40861.1 MAG: hypothetical protein A2894_04670 [Candidatus Levybacteria bacterium RIFCSPLOWO2_01_FULL_40_64]OGH49620.1 MAG: hypothetical protein A3I54_04920 [Candidatus Levybacteria bacterium RIFCSPLOWO2_02_FULL_41_11]OGH52782.1 MAG: hypothetical protein A3G15_00420 [Candidatus Levy